MGNVELTHFVVLIDVVLQGLDLFFVHTIIRVVFVPLVSDTHFVNNNVNVFYYVLAVSYFLIMRLDDFLAYLIVRKLLFGILWSILR